MRRCRAAIAAAMDENLPGGACRDLEPCRRCDPRQAAPSGMPTKSATVAGIAWTCNGVRAERRQRGRAAPAGARQTGAAGGAESQAVLSCGTNGLTMKTLNAVAVYSPNGPHQAKPLRRYNAWAAANGAPVPVSRYRWV